MTNNKPEILAPVGGEEQLKAAVRSGADAVYFGAPDFNARRNAKNFGGEEFVSAVEYCRKNGVKAYITLNTLIKDSETGSLLKTLELIAKSGADAVIVQDFAAARAVKECCPSLPLHASTQMAVHSVEGAKLLCEYGFSRIVLARENSLSEITEICRSTDAEIEVFVHGAHCMSASGMCYLSSVLGARSGNRGLCAQPCRLDFRANGNGYALSLKDMSLLGHLDELKNAGVASLKIEGRMKRPEYVAGAVTAVRQALGGEEYDLVSLKNVFSRSGFTDGYLTARRTREMFGFRTKDDVVSAKDALPGLQALYKDEFARFGADMDFSAAAGKKMTLTVSDGTNTVTVSGDVPEKAQNRAASEEDCRAYLFKLGGTPYYEGKFACGIENGLYIRAASLNSMRREALGRLDEMRIRGREHRFESVLTLPEKKENVPAGKKIYARFENADAVPDGIDFDRIILPAQAVLNNPALIKKYGDALACELPALIYPADENKVYKDLVNLGINGVKYIYCENIGALALAKKAGLEVIAGAGLNILNSVSLNEYAKLGVGEAVLSFENSFQGISRFCGDIPFGYIAYGYLPLMRFRCCPMQKNRGCENCTGDSVLTDRMGIDFRVLCSGRKYSTLFNSVPLYTGNMKQPSCSFALLYFTKETKQEAAEIHNSFIKGEKPSFRRTGGLYDRELL